MKPVVTRQRNRRALFLYKEIFLYTLLSVLTVSTISYGYLKNTTIKQRRMDITYAEKLSNLLSSELGNAAGIISSVASVQQILEDPYGDQLDAIGARAIASSNLIISLARYDRVEFDNLSRFIYDMSESGMYNFSLASFNDNGKRVAVEKKDVYYPIIWRQPFSPMSANLIGIDLSGNENIYGTVRESELSNAIQIAALPSEWNVEQNSDLLLVTSSYFGRYAPADESERATMSNGGVVMGIGLSDFININNLIKPGFDISVWLQTSSEKQAPLQKEIYRDEGEAQSRVYFKGLFKGINSVSAPLPNNRSLQIKIMSHGGISQKDLIQAGLIAIASSFLLLVLFSMLYIIRQRAVAHSRDREEALTTLSAIGDAVVATDENKVITYVNPSTEALLGQAGDQLIGQNVADTIRFKTDCTEDLRKSNSVSFSEALNSDAAVNMPTLKLNSESGKDIFVSSTISPLSSENQFRNNGHVLVMRDITAEREMTRELAFLATHDSLTELSNRYHFENELKRLIKSSVDNSTSHSICYIDLDQFKAINDTCGHSAGDKLLVRVSQGLKNVIRENDVLARLGGDEFGLLIRDCKEEEAIEIAKLIYSFFQTLYFQHEKDVFAVRASIGFVHISKQFDDISAVMAAADLACYSAKDKGRNELHIFNPSHEETSDRMSEMMWLPKLQMALISDQFRLFVQPIVGIQSSHAEHSAPYQHYEILLRLVTEDGALITPAQLIVAAERYNLMRDIDRWVVSNACRLISQLHAELGDGAPRFSINISGQSSVDKEFPGFVREQIKKSGVDPTMLIFEITETSAITNMQSAVELVDILHEVGCKLALDDFGSGVSSFGYLKTLPVDYLKIDGQFIKNIDTNEVDREMVKCMKAVAGILGIGIVAEFVEHQGIVDVLQELGIEYAQGYHYGKPHAIDELFGYGSLRKAA